MRIGSCEVGELIGQGGMGVVYKGRAPGGDLVAVKVLARPAAESVARFERERALLAALGDAEGFVPLLDAGESPRGPYVVMPFVPGGTLRDRLRNGPLPIDEATVLVAMIARALGVAHARGIVHRDLKPENVLFAADGRPLVADLGLAKHFGAPDGSSLSRSGVFRGTAGYGAPEQVQDAKTAGPPADVFSLGAILHECLAGVPPFTGESALEVLAKVVDVDHDSVRGVRPDVPAGLAEVVDRALAKDPSDRFADGEALARALERAQAPRSDRVRLVRALALAALASVGFLAFAIWRAGARPGAPGSSVQDRVATEARAEAERLAREGEGLARTGRASEARAAVDRALARDPLCALAHAVRGAIRLDEGKLDEAARDLERALELDAATAAAWGARGALRRARGDLAGTVSDASRAIELAPGDSSAWAIRGDARRRQGALREALRDLDRAVELDPGAGWIRSVRSEARLAARDLPGALADADRAVGLSPGAAAALVARACVRDEMDDRDACIADCSRAIALEPASAPAWYWRGDARKLAGDLDGAFEDLSQAIRLDASHAGAWESRSDVRKHQGNFDGAIADASRAIELEPRNARHLFCRGTAREFQGDLDGALADLGRATELAPEASIFWATRGEVWDRKKDPARAIADLSRAIELEPRKGLYWATRGEIRRKVGDRNGGRSDLARALEVDPRMEGAAYVKEVLETLDDGGR